MAPLSFCVCAISAHITPSRPCDCFIAQKGRLLRGLRQALLHSMALISTIWHPMRPNMVTS